MFATKENQNMSNIYTFNHDGTSHSIPSFSDLPIGVIRKSRKADDEADKVFIILETLLGEDSEALAAVDSMNASQFNTWLEGWTQGASVGESSGSES